MQLVDELGESFQPLCSVGAYHDELNKFTFSGESQNPKPSNHQIPMNFPWIFHPGGSHSWRSCPARSGGNASMPGKDDDSNGETWGLKRNKVIIQGIYIYNYIYIYIYMIYYNIYIYIYDLL